MYNDEIYEMSEERRKMKLENNIFNISVCISMNLHFMYICY